MSFDREKLRRTAEKNLAQGRIQAAIRDYCQIVESDTRDYNTLNTLGDLYARVESKNEAVHCFRRIAEYYHAQGFAHKAIAMYKKIARLQPETMEISAKLAPLYQMLGLVSEARTNYQAVAEAYQRNGEQLKALEIWQQIADLDPNDTATRLKLAESYVKEGENEKAVEAFTEAGSRQLAKKQFEPALAAFNEALRLDAHFLPALSGVTYVHIALGFPDEAIEKLEDALNIQPENVELLSLLAHAYLEMNNAAAAESATLRLVEREPTSYKRLLDVVKLYARDGDLNSAVRTLELCAEPLLSNGLEADLELWLNEILSRDPEHLKALRMLSRLRGWQRDELELKDVLERLAEAARLAEDEEEERNALSELRTLFPAEKQYAERLRELIGDLPALDDEETNSQSEQNNIPSFDTFATLAGEGENGFVAMQSQFAEAVETNEWQSFEQNDFAARDEAEVLTENNHFDNYSENQSEQSFAEFAENADSSHSFATREEVMTLDDAEEPDEPAADFTVTEFIQADESGANAESAPLAPNAVVHLLQELDSVDFYIEQGYDELALETLHLLRVQFGEHEQIQARSASLQQQIENKAPNEFNHSAQNFGTLQPEINLNGDSANLRYQPPAIESNQLEAASVLSDVNLNFADLLAELGENMQVGEMRDVQIADYETHYNLGLAYKEMGLYDDAVEEFQTAVKMSAPGDGTPRYLQCCNLIGHCFVEKDMPKLAVKWYQRGVDAPGNTEEESLALRYELGTAYQRAGEGAKAAEVFSEIYSVDVGYRSVGDKLRALQVMS